MALELQFRVNNEPIGLYIEEGESDLMFKLTNDDEFAVSYLKELAQNKFIKINGDEITTVARVEEEEEILILDEGGKENADAGTVQSTSHLPDQRKDAWGNDETRFILDKYESYLSMVGPLKRFKKKKNLWEQISRDLQAVLQINKTAIQVENRYKTVMKRKKRAVDHNSGTGETREEIPFEQELGKIAAADDSIEPEVLQSAQTKVVLKNAQSVPSTSTPPKKKMCRTPTSVEKAVEILKQQRAELHVEKEAAREKRHREKMELLKAFIASSQGNSSD